MASGYWSPLAIGVADGPVLTAAAAATMLPVTAKFTFPPNSISVGTHLRIRAWGRISNAVTTPGTARFDVRLGGIVVYDTGALGLNIVVKNTVPWRLDIDMICRAVGSGTSANFFSFGQWQSESYILSPVETTGPAIGNPIVSVTGPETAPAIGAGFDSTVSNTFDMFFTQTVSTGSFTVHNFLLESGSLALT